jgi:hypothetical protein
MPRAWTIRALLIANLACVGAGYGVAAFLGYFGWAATGSGASLAALGLALAACAATGVLTIAALGGVTPRVAMGLAVLSLPVYAYYAIEAVYTGRAARDERRLATTFLTGDSAAAAAAGAALAQLPHQSGRRPATDVLLAGLAATRDVARQHAIVELLGALSVRDPSVVPTRSSRRAAARSRRRATSRRRCA